MSEQPPKTCPPCPYLGQYQNNGVKDAGDAAAASATFGAQGGPAPCLPPDSSGPPGLPGLPPQLQPHPQTHSQEQLLQQQQQLQKPPPREDITATQNNGDGPAPCYFPQFEDTISPAQKAAAEGRVEEMGPIGPWATGRVDWGPLAGLTGTRPVVDKYSITRYSEGEWRSRNAEFFKTAQKEMHHADIVEWNSKQCMEQTRQEIDRHQEENTRRLEQRAKEVHRWKCELERAIAAAGEEISFLEEQRQRLMRAGEVLMMPESIAGECLERRTSRLEPELVRDDVEEELMKELALTSEIRDLFNRTLSDIEEQLTENKAAKQRLEYDWSDKKTAHEIEASTVALNNTSTTPMWKPGATRFPSDQSTPEHWEHFTRETLRQAEATRQKSVALRSTLDDILNNASRDLRTQADKVEAALAKKVACTDEIRQRLEDELMKLLVRIADSERIVEELKDHLRKLDQPMKVAQTRLDNRLQRPRVENCRDPPQFGLVDEVKTIAEKVSAVKAQIHQAESVMAGLLASRNEIEREVMIKRKTLEIDRERLRFVRDHYPSATALIGH